MAEGCDLLGVGAVECLLAFAAAAEREHGPLEHVFVLGCVGGIDGQAARIRPTTPAMFSQVSEPEIS